MPAITVVGATSTGNAFNGSNRAVNVPSGAANKDVAVCILDRWFGSNTNPAVTTPSDFVPINGAVNSGDSAAKLTAYYKRLTAADGGQYTFSWTGAAWTILHCIMLRNVIETGDPLADVLKSVAGTYGSVPSLSLTADVGAAVIWRMYNDSTGTHTPPTGFTEPAGLDNDSASLAYRIATATGTQTASGGSVSSSSPAAAILIGFKPQPDSGSSGTLTASLPGPSAALAGTARANAVMAATLPTLAGSLAGQGIGSGLLAVNLPMPSAALAASAVGAGALAVVLPSTAAGLTGQARASAGLAGDLPGLVVVLAGEATSEGTTAANLPDLVASLSGSIRNLAALVGDLPLPTADMSGAADTDESLLLVVLSLPDVVLAAEATASGGLTGALPALTGATFGNARSEALLLDGLPTLEGQFFGQLFAPDSGQLLVTLPALVAATGRMSQVRERDHKRRGTRQFIMASPVEIALVPSGEVRTPGGGVEMVDTVARPVQTFRLIPMSHTERAQESANPGGVQRRYDMTILGEWDAVFEENDYWEDEKGQRYVIEELVPYNGYERKGLVVSYGRKGSTVG